MADKDTSEKAEHREVLKLQLQTTWLALSPLSSTQHPALRKKLDTLLLDSSADIDWAALNEAQLLLLHFMPVAMLRAKLLQDVERALKRDFIGQARHDDMKLLAANPTSPEEQLRETYRGLLEEIQSGSISVRFRREKRRAAGATLLWTSAVVLVVALIPLFVMTIADSMILMADFTKTYLLRDPFFGAYAAASFGIVGAFFSRLVPFQRRLDELDYNQLLFSFSARFIALRCAIGLLGALMFYLFMRSNLVRADVFPKFELVDGKPPPVSDLSRLLVWSFIAGWSERLVPDTLEGTESKFAGEARGKAGVQAKDTPEGSAKERPQVQTKVTAESQAKDKPEGKSKGRPTGATGTTAKNDPAVAANGQPKAEEK